MTFGEILKRLRERAALTQAALAEKSGVSLRTIQGWEQDYRCPVSASFFTLVKALGVSADAFAESTMSGQGAATNIRSAPRGKVRPSTSRTDLVGGQLEGKRPRSRLGKEK
jgi:transcriptional regulator with XRE-family HTH domain